jgi:hypothetical protein
MSNSIGGFNFGGDEDPSLVPEGLEPDNPNVEFDIDDFEQAARQEPPAPVQQRKNQKKSKASTKPKKSKSQRDPSKGTLYNIPNPEQYVEDPIPDGMTRLYHGSVAHDRTEGPAWFSSNRKYAESYRDNSILQYVDVPTDWANAQVDPNNYGQTIDKGYTLNIQLDSSFTGKRRVVGQRSSSNTVPTPAQSASPPDSFRLDHISMGSEGQPPSPSGSGAGQPPSKPPAPPNDYSDYPENEYPEDPDNKPSVPQIITQPDELKAEKDAKELQKKNLESAKQKFRDFIREEKDKFAREFRDEKLSLNREVQKLNNEAVKRKTEINRASSEAKTAIYSVSAGIGLPGYIIASVADAAIIQPAVRQDIKAEQQYQADLRDYKNENVDILNRKKDAFREYTKSNEYSKLPDEVKEKFANTGEIPAESIPSFEEWATKVGNKDAFGAISGKAPTAPIGKAQAVTNMLGKAGPIVAGVIEVAQLGVSAVKQGGELVRSNISSSLNKDGVSAVGTKIKDSLTIADPLGISPSVQMYKEAVDTFESAVKDFGSYAREDLGFSPLSIQADVEGSIMRLEQSMQIAQQTDPQKAQMIQVTDEINLIWNEFRALFFSGFAPVLIFFLNGFKFLLQALLDTIKLIKLIAMKIAEALAEILSYVPGMSMQGYILKQILKALSKPPVVTTSVLQQAVDDFHNPNNRPTNTPKPRNYR